MHQFEVGLRNSWNSWNSWNGERKFLKWGAEILEMGGEFFEILEIGSGNSWNGVRNSWNSWNWERKFLKWGAGFLKWGCDFDAQEWGSVVRSKLASFLIRSHIRNAPFWSRPPGSVMCDVVARYYDMKSKIHQRTCQEIKHPPPDRPRSETGGSKMI